MNKSQIRYTLEELLKTETLKLSNSNSIMPTAKALMLYLSITQKITYQLAWQAGFPISLKEIEKLIFRCY